MTAASSDAEFVAAAIRHAGRSSLIAKELGVQRRGVRYRLKRMIEDGRINPQLLQPGVTGTSTLYGPEGEVKLTWVKESRAERDIEQWAAILKEQLADVRPVKPIPAPATVKNSLLVVIPIGDHHVGMYSWGEETGADYDVRIAERLLVSGAKYLIDASPACETCVIANVGDFFHYDSHRAETPTNKHALDADTRYAAMIRAGISMLRTFIETALAKYKRVHVINAPGNHDPIGALWLSIALACLYERNPRVTVDQSPGKFAYYDHGKVMLCVTHGDTTKIDKLGQIMAADRPEMWGRTVHRYGITGHTHQNRVIEVPGCRLESFRTLAARDAWTQAAGYRSSRDMTAITYHREHGEVGRQRFDAGMLQ